MSGACTSSSPSADADEPPSTGSPADDAGQRSQQAPPRPSVGVIGVCGSGKSTLVAGLRRLGYDARQISQEHSYVPDLWRRFSRPDVLVFLEATDATVVRRVGPLPYPGLLQAQRGRLAGARMDAHVRVDTDDLSAGEVLETVAAAIAALAPTGHRRAG